MKALHGGTRTFDSQREYHMADGRAINFEVGQAGRIDLARFLVEKILLKEQGRPFRIVELGCGAGDISGPYSGSGGGHQPSMASLDRIYTFPRGMIDTLGIEVIGIDWVPAAADACRERWPGMTFLLSPVEEVEPMKCDLLVMCEFLEHVTSPLTIVEKWMPRARWAIIGHPLDEPDPPFEPGHCWSYNERDWAFWFEHTNHQVWEKFTFPMGGWERMIMGHSSRR